MMDYTPKSNKAEWSITYRCDLACRACCRFCYWPATTPDMTLADADNFTRQAREFGWRPDVWIIGGEPTLHPDFVAMVEAAFAFTGRVRVFSNGFRPEAKALLAEVETRHPGCVERSTHKPTGSIRHLRADHCVAPRDFGVTSRVPCHVHAGYAGGCGISVDADGFTVCPNGGAIDGIMGLGVRTKRLADLFDHATASRQTDALCTACGCDWGARREIQPGQCAERFGVLMSESWQRAVDRLTVESGESK